MSEILKVNPSDNVIVALQPLRKGEKVLWQGQEYLLTTDVPAKHKFVTEDIKVGQDIVMYGTLVGKATQPILRGSTVTTANVRHSTAEYQNRNARYSWTSPDVSKWKDKTFLGYSRSDSQVGTANFWLVIPMVFCENRNVNTMREAFEKELGYARPGIYSRQVADLAALYRKGKSPGEIASLQNGEHRNPSKDSKLFEQIDGIKFLTHEGGCGGTREDTDALCALFAGCINNPNVAGATVLSLGCQHSQVAILEAEIHKRNPKFDKPLLVFEQQKSSSEFALLSRAIKQTFLELIKVNELTRTPAPLSKLTVGVECGGSDGFSGISANPAIGYASDLVVALGGKVILSEFPELCGVEQHLIDRCKNSMVTEKFIALMKAYSARAEAVGSGFDMNPSPGNIRDGLITDAMKSAGAALKGGTSAVNAVLGYPEYAQEPGLNLLCTPGNDVESTTGMAGSGANLILFSTLCFITWLVEAGASSPGISARKCRSSNQQPDALYNKSYPRSPRNLGRFEVFLQRSLRRNAAAPFLRTVIARSKPCFGGRRSSDCRQRW